MNQFSNIATAVLVLLTFNIGFVNAEQNEHDEDTSVLELVKLLDSEIASRAPNNPTVENRFESALQKIIKHGRKAEEPLLFKLRRDTHLRVEMESKLSQLEFGSRDYFKQSEKLDRLRDNLELLTALRRVQKEPDPLLIEVTSPKNLTAFPGKLPSVSVTLRSVDVNKNSLWMQLVPNFHASRREAQWRFEVRTKTGDILPTIPNPGLERSSDGHRSYGWLRYGEHLETVLRIGDFVNIRDAGEYAVTLAYHARLPIADIENPLELEKLIVFRSETFKLVAEPPHKRVIKLSQADRDTVASLLVALPGEGLVKIVEGVYDEDDYAFVSPSSVPGKLLTLNWVAVPSLIDSLSEESLTLHQKAWVLSLLFTITGEHDLNPIDYPGSTPDFSTKADQSMSEAPLSGNSRIAPAKQQTLISKWITFRDDWIERIDE